MTTARGFTLLELLMATALAAMLMVGVLAVVASIASPAHEAAQTRGQGVRGIGQVVSDAPPVDAWVALLREDLAHARSVKAQPDGSLVLAGYTGLAGAGRERSHRPAVVTYSVKRIEGRDWLVRRQVLLDVLSNQNVQNDLVAAGVSRFEVLRDGKAPAVALTPPVGRGDNPEAGQPDDAPGDAPGDAPDEPAEPLMGGATQATDKQKTAAAREAARREQLRRMAADRRLWEQRFGWVQLTENGEEIGYKWWEQTHLFEPPSQAAGVGNIADDERADDAASGDGAADSTAADQAPTVVPWHLRYWTDADGPATEVRLRLESGGGR